VRLVLAFSSVVLVALTMIGPADGDTNAHRAAVSFWAMRHEFLDKGTDTYRATAGASGAAAAWPYSQALAATIAMTAVPKLGRLYIREAERRIDGLKRYLGPNAAYAAGIGSGDVYTTTTNGSRSSSCTGGRCAMTELLSHARHGCSASFGEVGTVTRRIPVPAASSGPTRTGTTTATPSRRQPVRYSR
jgi:hypothetical protein